MDRFARSLKDLVTEVDKLVKRGIEGVADLLRMLGPLDAAEVAMRLDASTSSATQEGGGSATQASAPEPVEGPAATQDDAAALLAELVTARRAIPVTIAGHARFAAIEDAGRLRDALGVALPTGIPVAFLEPVADPVGDLVSRHARTHGPFTTDAVADRFGLGAAVARHTLQRLESSGRLASGFFLPAADAAPGGEQEWCDSEVLRRLRMRSLAAIRGSVEPVSPQAYARFLPDWQHLTRPLEGVDGVLSVIEQFAGVPIPASAWESLVLPSRVRDYTPAMLDELTAAGEVVWAGHGTLPGRDGWVSLHPADLAPFTLPVPEEPPAPGSLDEKVLDVLRLSGASFAGALRAMTDAENEQSVLDALWALTWQGHITNDTFAPVRALLAGGSQAHKTTRRAPRTRTYRGVSLARPASRPASTNLAGGRWAVLPEADPDAARRATVTAGLLLDRYGVVTRGAVQAEGVPGGFAQAYRVLAGFEEAGHCRRGYVIERLGAAQFAASTTVDRLRTFAGLADPPPRRAITLAATDPANPYGAALAWPRLDAVSHRPGRKAGGLVVLVDGALVLYLERGGRTVLAFDDDPEVLQAATADLAATARSRKLETLTVEKINGESVYGTPFALALQRAGFVATPRGYTLRKGV